MARDARKRSKTSDGERRPAPRDRDARERTRDARARAPEITYEPFAAPSGMDHALAALLGVAVLAVYILTLCPTVPGGDSGELIAVANGLGVAHPPGYPLYTLLGKLFTFVPHGSIAWRVNLLSAVCDAGATVLLFAAVRRWSGDRWAALFAAGLFAFSPLVWGYAIVAEVFPLNNLFVTALLYLAQRYSTDREPRVALVGAFLSGLGLANHHTFLFVAFPFSMWLLWFGRRELFERRRFLQLLACFAAGLLPYLYLPIAAARYPAISWGDASTVQGFLTHLLRREYGTLQLGTSEVGAGSQLGNGLVEYAKELVGQSAYVGVVLAFIGIAAAWRRDRSARVLAVSCFIFVFYVVVFHKLANLSLENRLYREVTARFWQQPNIFVFCWAGLGFAAVMARLPARARLIAPALALTAVIAQGTTRYRGLDQSTNRTFFDLGHGMLDGLPKDAILLTSGDIYTNATRYLQSAEGVRPDVTILDRGLLSSLWIKPYLERVHPEVKLPGAYLRPNDAAGFSLEQFFRANERRSEIFLSNLDANDDRGWEKVYTTWPWGVLNWVVPRDRVMDYPQYVSHTASLLTVLDGDAHRNFAPGTWERVVWNDYWEADHRKARRILAAVAGSKPVDEPSIRLAIGLLEKLIARAPIPTNEMYRNLGIMYSLLLNTDPAAEAQMVKAWRVYLQTNPPDDKDIGEIRKAIARFEAKPKK